MNTIQKALRMLNESYNKEQEALNEAIVDQDGDIEVTSFSLRDLTGEFGESCKDDSCEESVDEAAEANDVDYYDDFIQDALYYINLDGYFDVYGDTKKKIDDILKAAETYKDGRAKSKFVDKKTGKRAELEVVDSPDGQGKRIKVKGLEIVDEGVSGKIDDVSALIKEAEKAGIKTVSELEKFIAEAGTSDAKELLKKLQEPKNECVNESTDAEMEISADEELHEESAPHVCEKCGKEVCECDEVEDTNFNLTESVATSMPVVALPESQVISTIDAIPAAAPGRPPKFFKLGYFKEVEVASKFRGGRGSKPEDPRVRVFKATEYDRLYTGADYENTGATKTFRKETGTERSGERTGFTYGSDGAVVNKIGTYADGSKALQAYLADNCKIKTKYFISLDDEDLRETDRTEVANYLTAANAAKLLDNTPRVHAQTKVDNVNPETGEVTQAVEYHAQPVNRFKIANIYAIDNLGTYIL